MKLEDILNHILISTGNPLTLKKKLQEIFPLDNKKYLKKCLNEYLREYKGDNIKKLRYEEIPKDSKTNDRS
ncbi:MAG: hypothetical protein K9G38_05245 [Bacteroidales bacterium]|nr:hypothetical protein [Bacteroidales bacterium]